MNSDVRIIRGLNIATLVFSIMGALIGGAFMALMISASSMLSDPTFFNAFVQELQAGSSGSAAFDGSSAANSYDYSSMSDEEIREAAVFGMNVVIGLAVGYLLLNVVGIAASIITLRALSTPEKLRSAFGWTIAGAVCQGVIFSIITCVCFVISAWMISRVRKSFAAYNQGFPYQGGMPQSGMYQGNPGQMNYPTQGNMPGQNGGYGAQQPMQPQQPQQPMQPQGGAVQPQQPSQPVAPQQPVQQQPASQPAQLQQPADSQQQPQQSDQPTQSTDQGSGETK
ncbi:MAG: hypothetical protein U0K14_05000 [Eggerthellaceae bacterium]|nr:hypothetical protein [Eggerthellaceae bacterium]